MTKPTINVTPLIDVLLVLLIIFMVVTPMKPSAFKTKVPQAPSNELSSNIDTLVVAISNDNSLRINREENLGTVDDPAKITEKLIEVFRSRQANYIIASLDEESVPRTVFIKAPRGINYGSVAKVVDAVKAAGADPISLQIDDL